MAYDLLDARVQKVVYGLLLIKRTKMVHDFGYNFTVSELADLSECTQPVARTALQTLQEAKLLYITELAGNRRSFKFTTSEEDLLETFTLITKDSLKNGTLRISRKQQRELQSVSARIESYESYKQHTVRSHVIESSGRTFCLPTSNTMSVKDTFAQVKHSGNFLTVRERKRLKEAENTL